MSKHFFNTACYWNVWVLHLKWNNLFVVTSLLYVGIAYHNLLIYILLEKLDFYTIFTIRLYVHYVIKLWLFFIISICQDLTDCVPFIIGSLADILAEDTTDMSAKLVINQIEFIPIYIYIYYLVPIVTY